LRPRLLDVDTGRGSALYLYVDNVAIIFVGPEFGRDLIFTHIDVGPSGNIGLGGEIPKVSANVVCKLNFKVP
jgi:hypothetical protein